jgi:hypothetical protein
LGLPPQFAGVRFFASRAAWFAPRAEWLALRAEWR